jgi:hypothetical protein
MLLLTACSDEKPPTQAVYEMIESSLQNTVISSSDTKASPDLHDPMPYIGISGNVVDGVKAGYEETDPKNLIRSQRLGRSDIDQPTNISTNATNISKGYDDGVRATH